MHTIRIARRGFTLIELLVVIAVVALLIGILLPALGSARDAARSTLCLSRLRTLGQMTSFHADENRGEVPRSSHSAGFNRLPWSAVLYEQYEERPFGGTNSAWDDASWWRVTNTHYRCPHDRRESPVRRAGLRFGLPALSYGLNVYFELRMEEIDPARHAGNRQEPYRKLTMLPFPTNTVVFGELPESSSRDHVMAHFWRTLDVPPGDGVAVDRHGSGSGYVFADGHAEGRDFGDVFDLDRGIDRWHPAPPRDVSVRHTN